MVEAALSEYRFTLELNDIRNKSESAGVGVPQTLAPRQGAITLGAGAHTLVVPPIAPLIRERLMRARLVFQTGPVVDTVAETWRGAPGWMIHLPGAVPHDFALNAVGDATIVEDQNAPNLDRRDTLQITGAAATALGNVTGAATLQFFGEVAKTLTVSQSSSVLLDAFFDDTIDGVLPNLTLFLTRVRQKITSQGPGLLVLAQLGQQTISINGASAAFGLGPPIIRNTDVGNGFGQIPVAPANWTAAAFAAHPRIFFRPSTHITAIRQISPFPVGAPAITADSANLFPLQAQRPPTHSSWRILLEGNIMDVIVAHPLGSDLRRPRDIWQKVWLPAIGIKTTPIFDYFFVGFAPDPSRSFYTVGLLNNLDNLDYAYCLDLYDGGGPLIDYPEI